MELKEALRKKKFVVTSEIQVTTNDDSSDHIVDDLNLVRGRIDSVAISDTFSSEFEGIVSDSVKTCEVLKKNRFDAIYQTTTRDKSRIQLQKDLVAAHESGVENILVFTEDYRITGESLQESMFFHVDSGKLSSVLDHFRDGCTFDGKSLVTPIDFVVGSGVESIWGKSVPKKGMMEMEFMRSIGTGYFLTTPIFDLEQFQKFVKQVKVFDVPVIAEVMLLRNAAMARFINRHFKSGLVPDWAIRKLDIAVDKKQASIELFAEITRGLKELCDGVHIITLGGIGKIKPYLDASKLI